MSFHTSRRQFLSTTALGGLGLLSQLPAVSAEDAKLNPDVVQLDAEIEPLVRLLSYREVLAALFLAGVRNVEPRPSVGFKFHAVLVVNAAHLASLASPDSERWLPIFWALDNFKGAQAQNIKERAGWRMPPVKESSLPAARNAKKAFVDAMEKWDAEAADVAVASLARYAGADEVAELFWRYAPRDFRAIGHKIIFAANTRRTLDAIGWRQHAEPVLRSLTYALMSSGNVNPAKSDDPADRPGRKNRELVKKIDGSWTDGKQSSAATTDLLAMLRQASTEEAASAVVASLNKGVAVQSIWDAIYAASGEMLMRRPGIPSLHAVTTANAIHFAFDTSGDDETRRWLLLQAASFVPLFRGEIAARKDKPSEATLDGLEPLPTKAGGAAAVEEIFADVSTDKTTAARKVLGYLKANGDPRSITDAARRLIFRKGTDAHDYKFSMAALEDYAHVSPEWRDRYLAASVFWLKGSGEKDTQLVKRTKAAIG
jgi:hypothetical protein